MKELQEFIDFLKSKGLEHKKIDIDLLCAITEYFINKECKTQQP